MPGFVVMTRNYDGTVNFYPVVAASLAAVETGVQNNLAATLATGLPLDPSTGQPDVSIAVRGAGLMGQTNQNPGEVLIGVFQAGAATKCIPGATPGTPITGWTI